MGLIYTAFIPTKTRYKLRSLYHKGRKMKNQDKNYYYLTPECQNKIDFSKIHPIDYSRIHKINYDDFKPLDIKPRERKRKNKKPTIKK